MSRILITGASGRLGSAAARALRDAASGLELFGLARSDSAAERLERAGLHVRRGDYSNPESLAAAFVGIDRLLFVSSPVLDPVLRIAHHRAVVAAASHVEHLVYTSAFGADHDPGHATTESLLAERPLPATVLRNGLYTEPFLRRALAEAASGVITSASAGRGLATAAVADLGEAAARALLQPPVERVLELRGPAWTYEQLAAAIAARTGMPVRHLEVAAADTGAFAAVFPLVAAGLLEQERDELAQLLGRPPRGIAAVVQEADAA
ncbi:MAG: hypothetical protein DI534_09310 [Leifsonia xyli]|nr:MAG: hypothetical protein DI534_09310 [Leifsonia xyli]